MKFDIITIFPNIFDGFLTESLLARAQKLGIIKIGIHNLRKWTTDRHQKVDDKPFGGGVGMVMKVEPIFKAVRSLRPDKKTRVILFSPRGKKLDQKTAKRLSKYQQLILICGRYEGVDERVAEYIANEVISIGDYVLNGGEVATIVVIEAVSRMIPGFIAKQESALKFDHAQYTRPEIVEIKKGGKIKRLKVPAVLLSGDHAKIEKWRKKHGALT
ncbi:MAG: tRNA (guanosine(37)-N1)-methyltransferase TrmD [Candidatus Yanofskybacteria bacterium RIFCSPHIGHO2_01_FULL_44_17]|uniref:tRNA (guanine-N(1)-)-methyltransferase n=1 Tax=Candidatus Yanofskybacteria bacterium RIFCSPHIGHO2_01_FULL_44_17 TaxID=1802668 RepID=A0A1F8EUE2_9BACT|nr:MAG: tRNA (guanosine(37)-N1)-methyltransferase TrmD [Candidatus Yanofskybacteria bacterium RIFCSPHIGHO2_01_FULL_44_17]